VDKADRLKYARELAEIGAVAGARVVEKFEQIKESGDLILVGALSSATNGASRELADLAERIGILTFASDANVAANARELLRGTSHEMAIREEE
jgi:hypothetical protein